MASEAKVVIIALLILAIGFFYTNVRDNMTGYVPAQESVDMEEYALITEESYPATEIDQALPIEQLTTPQKESLQKEVSLEKIFPDDLRVDPCLTDVPQLQTLMGGVC